MKEPSARVSFTLFIAVIILQTFIYSQGYSGIHQMQSEYYKKHYDESSRQQESGSIQPNQPRERTPSHEVFGYHPYWMGTSWQNYNFDLISTLAFFSAEANATGGLDNLHEWPSTGLINEAHAHGTNVVLCVTLFSNSNLVTLLSNLQYRQNLIDNLLYQVQLGNADGVNVDFESFPASQKENMVIFITDLTETFHSEIPGSQVTLAMPAVDWSDGWNYNALASISDGLFIMGYAYHWSGSSTSGPNSPLTGSGYTLTWTVNDYLNKTNNQADKLILGVPYYGFEWPTETNQAGSQTTGSGSAKFYAEMEGRALSYGKLWHESSQTPWYRYENPNWIQGWYDDSLSLSLKYDFAMDQNLKGVGMWALGYDGSNSELWNLLYAKFTQLQSETDGHSIVPASLQINRIYPNPFNASVTVEFSLPTNRQDASIILTDLLGRVIQKTSIVQNNQQTTWTWTGIDKNGIVSPTGLYFVIINNGEQTQSRKITLLK